MQKLGEDGLVAVQIFFNIILSTTGYFRLFSVFEFEDIQPCLAFSITQNN